MVAWSTYIRNLGTAAAPTIQGIKNLGFALMGELGDAATKDVGTGPDTVAAGDDERIKGAMQRPIYDPNDVAANAFDSANISFLPDLSGVFPRPSIQRFFDQISVLDAMASGGLDVAVRNAEVTDADASEVTAAINNAQEDLALRGVGELFYPRGLYPVTYSANSLTHRCAVIGKSGVRHKGAGRGQTIIRLADGANCHMLAWRNGVDAGMSSITIDGNAAGQSIAYDGTEGVAVLCLAEARQMAFRDLHIKDAPDYGIGIQVGTAIGVDIENILIERAGADGIDFKNTSDNSKENYLRRVTVRRFGLQGSATTENFAGVELRGQVMANAIRVEGVGFGDTGSRGRAGIRLNAGEVDGEVYAGDHLGALRTILDDFYIEGIDGSASALASHYGLWARHRQCSISNGIIRLCGSGFVRSQRENAISNIIIDSCRRGFRSVLDETGGGLPLLTQPDRDTISAMQIRGCSEIGADIRSDASTFLGLMARGNAQNLNISAGADGNRFIGGSVSAPTGATNFVNSGSGTVFRNVEGVVNEVEIQSGTFAIDSTGVKEVTIPHGMSFPPMAAGVSLTLLTSSPNPDFQIGWMRPKTIDATNIVVEVRVIAASVTAGAVARVGLKASRLAF